MLAEAVLHAPTFNSCQRDPNHIEVKKEVTNLNFSIQSIPFGSSLEYTKQLNAALNSSPHGPWAIPPRHGQSQLISPVSGSNAASWPASSSSSWGDFSGELAAAAACSRCSLILGLIELRVGSLESSSTSYRGGWLLKETIGDFC